MYEFICGLQTASFTSKQDRVLQVQVQGERWLTSGDRFLSGYQGNSSCLQDMAQGPMAVCVRTLSSKQRELDFQGKEWNSHLEVREAVQPEVGNRSSCLRTFTSERAPKFPAEGEGGIALSFHPQTIGTTMASNPQGLHNQAHLALSFRSMVSTHIHNV